MAERKKKQPEASQPIKENPVSIALEVIKIDTQMKHDPTLDPASPDFDPEKWKKRLLETGERMKAAADRLKNSALASLLPLAHQASETQSAYIENAFNTLQGLSNKAVPFISTMQDYFGSDAWNNLRATLSELAENVDTWIIAADNMASLLPYLTEELKQPQYGGRTFDELLKERITDDDGNLLARQALAAAEAARDAAEAEEPERAIVKRAKTVGYPLDKPNSIIWNLLEHDTQGQIAFNMAKRGMNEDIPAFYAIDFEALGDNISITKRLMPFDKRVYIAISGLFNAGNNVITLSQIHYTMGNTGRPSTKQLEKINDSITKMTSAKIFFDNEQEAEKLKGYAHFRYDGSLLPIERGTVSVKGQLTDAAIHIFREPPLISFARQRKQITTIEVKLLQSPVSKTEGNLLIDDYLLERISKAKNGKGKCCRILLKTLCDHAGITTAKQKQRALEKINKYLNHYQQCGFISRYTMEKDGITIHWK